jgi:hypothetical protein
MRIVIPILLLAACAAPRPEPQAPGSRGPHASEHLQMADEHEEVARQQAMYPDTRPDATGRTDQLLVGTTSYHTWDTVQDQQRAAAAHRSEAQAIHAAYQEACGDRSTSEVAASPIVKFGIGGQPTKEGAIVYLSAEAGPPDRLMADLKCHRAWMRLAPANMDACPLDLAGLRVSATATPDGIALTLTVSDPKLIPELQRRVAHDLELGATRSH